MVSEVFGFFAGVGVLFLFAAISTFILVIVWLYWQLAQPIKHTSRYESKYSILQESMLERVGKKRGVNLIERLRLEDAPRGRRFKRKVEELLLSELTGKKEKEEE